MNAVWNGDGGPDCLADLARATGHARRGRGLASAAVTAIAVSAAHRARAGGVLDDPWHFVVPAFPDMALLRDAATMPTIAR